MPNSFAHYAREIKRILNLPNNLEIKIIDRIWGTPINKRKVVEPINLGSYLRTVSDETRIATFIHELERRIGAQVGAKIEFWLAGHRIDGRRSIAGLR